MIAVSKSSRRFLAIIYSEGVIGSKKGNENKMAMGAIKQFGGPVYMLMPALWSSVWWRKARLLRCPIMFLMKSSCHHSLKLLFVTCLSPHLIRTDLSAQASPWWKQQRWFDLWRETCLPLMPKNNLGNVPWDCRLFIFIKKYHLTGIYHFSVSNASTSNHRKLRDCPKRKRELFCKAS